MTPALIALDWGSSHVRGFLLDARGLVLERRHSAHGLRHLPDGGFDAALSAIIQGWPPCPRLACGMVGARGGWQEVAYLDAPVGVDDIAAGLGQVSAYDGQPVWIVPGVRKQPRLDVMRGEETQVVGALAHDPALGNAAVLILPGTHCKWVGVRDGQIVDVRTAITGELFSILLRHSLLAGGCDPAAPVNDARFLDGVRAVRDSGAAGGFLRLFSARALWLDGQLATDEVPGWLSGVLIGEEIRGMLADTDAGAGAVWQLIGEAALCQHYRQALAEFSIQIERTDLDSAALGLWQIAQRAGMVSNAEHLTKMRDKPRSSGRGRIARTA